jgi:hypothetical protein
MKDKHMPAHLGTSPQEYARLGIKQSQIEQWEDGMRTDGSPNTYEWWYFDAHLDDGSKVVITFFTKPIFDVKKPLSPQITFNLDRPDGTSLEKILHAPTQEFTASTKGCDVRIGSNSFQGDLHTYQIHVEIEDVVADIQLTGTVPAWRPETGHFYFGDQDQHVFAWLPSVPQGQVQATITVGNQQQQQSSGIGYHDHNWGNISMLKLMHHWYWGRAKVGDYTVIASYITVEEEYGYQEFPIFLLARSGQILADDGRNVSFSASEIYTDDVTKKPVANDLVYTYQDNTQKYVVTFHRQQDIVRQKFVDTLPGIKAWAARLAGMDGAYLRFTGEVKIERYDEKMVESRQDEAIWELMYFGHVH